MTYVVFRLQVSNIDERRKDQDGLDDLVKDPDANVNIRNAVSRGGGVFNAFTELYNSVQVMFMVSFK